MTRPSPFNYELNVTKTLDLKAQETDKKTWKKHGLEEERSKEIAKRSRKRDKHGECMTDKEGGNQEESL